MTPVKPNPYALKAKKSREEIVLEHAPLIKRIVSRIAARLPPEVERDELYQAGSIGLLDAVDKFDDSKEVLFKTYAEFRIKGAIIDELRAMDWIPRSVRSAAHQMEDAYIELSNHLGREPSDGEMSKQMKMSLSEYHEFVNKARPIPLISLEDFGSGEDGDDLNILDILSDPDAEDPFSNIAMREVREELAKAIKTLPQQEQQVLALYYNEEMNLKEIGEVLGLTESRVSQIRTKIIVKLRANLKPILPTLRDKK